MADLEDNIILAHCANEHVKKSLIFGAANRPNSTDEARLRVSRGRLLGKLLSPIYSFISLFSTNDLIMIQLVYFHAMLYQAGNCGEQSTIALLYLKELGVSNLDLVFLDNGDHAFVVIGRDPHSDINDFTTWGENAVICDPWGQRYFPASDIVFQLNDILHEANYGGFNPIAQTIHLSYTSHARQQSDFTSLQLSKINPDMFKKQTNQYNEYQKSKTNALTYKKYSVISNELSNDTFKIGLGFGIPASIKILCRKKTIGAVACSVATASFFTVSAITNQLAKFTEAKSKEIESKQHAIWR